MTAREDLHAAFVDAMQDGNWHMTADRDHAKATAMVDAAITEAEQRIADWIAQRDPENELGWFIDRLRAGLANHDQLRCSLYPMLEEVTL